ncbi:MAG TPA: hypothetical protein PLZ45_02745 [Ferruginibacter sp.]|nr:hypothetical protein [Chitinophagaceae bacterium]HRI23562.1 hypothetical protein [Ferruginibacter sp.]
MKTELLASHPSKTEETTFSYLWLNGERVIGIEGLEIFEDCRQLHQLPGIKKEQREELNAIINASLERYAEEGICDYWPCLVSKAKEYFSGQGYCVIKKDKVTIDLRQQVELSATTFAPEQEANPASRRLLTVADLWNIQRMVKMRTQRRYIW